jgi:hypothetical protein
MARAYVCNRFPFLKIGEAVAFHNGLFETDDPELQALIERNDWWGVHIHPRDVPVGDVAPQPLDPVVSEARVRHGARSSRTVRAEPDE